MTSPARRKSRARSRRVNPWTPPEDFGYIPIGDRGPPPEYNIDQEEVQSKLPEEWTGGPEMICVVGVATIDPREPVEDGSVEAMMFIEDRDEKIAARDAIDDAVKKLPGLRMLRAPWNGRKKPTPLNTARKNWTWLTVSYLDVIQMIELNPGITAAELRDALFNGGEHGWSDEVKREKATAKTNGLITSLAKTGRIAKRYDLDHVVHVYTKYLLGSVSSELEALIQTKPHFAPRIDPMKYIDELPGDRRIAGATVIQKWARERGVQGEILTGLVDVLLEAMREALKPRQKYVPPTLPKYTGPGVPPRALPDTSDEDPV